MALVAATSLVVPFVDEGDETDEVGGTDDVPVLIIESAVTTIPASCITPTPLRSVFVGEVTKIDANFVLYEVTSERFGTVGELVSNGVLTVRYPIDDVKYLEVGEQFLVGAVAAPSGIRGDVPVLESKIRVLPDMFGGDAVAAVQRVSCPDYDDPVRTLQVNGDPVDTGILRPLLRDRAGILRIALLPLGVGLGLLFLLAATRFLITGAIRGMRR